MRYRIYKDNIGYFIKEKTLFGWDIILDTSEGRLINISWPRYFKYLSDAEKEVQKLKLNKKPELIKEL